MYLSRYKLKAEPFGLEADPDFFFLCDRHAEARRCIDQVLWHDETFAAILGERGIGKTMLLEYLLDDVAGEVPLIHLSALISRPVELLRSLLSVLGFDDMRGEPGEYRKILSAYLSHQQRQGSRPVLVLDNIESYSIAVLEELRWLASIGDGERCALHFLVFGREEFAERLLENPIRDLGDLIRARYVMRGLSEGETLAYINHRLDLVGSVQSNLISESAVALIFRYTEGVPRRINQLCTAALDSAARDDMPMVRASAVEKAIEKLGLEPPKTQAIDTGHDSLGAFRRGQSGKFVITFAGKLCGTVPLDQDRLVIGRHKLNNICIDSHAVSRCHAQVILVDGLAVLMDLNSTNGTFVNFKRVQQHVLRDNDIVSIGKHRLKFVAGVEQKRTTAAAVPSASPTVVLEGDGFGKTRPAMKRVK